MSDLSAPPALQNLRYRAAMELNPILRAELLVQLGDAELRAQTTAKALARHQTLHKQADEVGAALIAARSLLAAAQEIQKRLEAAQGYMEPVNLDELVIILDVLNEQQGNAETYLQTIQEAIDALANVTDQGQIEAGAKVAGLHKDNTLTDPLDATEWFLKLRQKGSGPLIMISDFLSKASGEIGSPSMQRAAVLAEQAAGLVEAELELLEVQSGIHGKIAIAPMRKEEDDYGPAQPESVLLQRNPNTKDWEVVMEDVQGRTEHAFLEANGRTLNLANDMWFTRQAKEKARTLLQGAKAGRTDQVGQTIKLSARAPMAKGQTCQDADPECPVCHGHCQNPATTTLYRVDMEDATGTPMCEACANDAMESGVFATEGEGEEEMEMEMAEQARMRKGGVPGLPGAGTGTWLLKNPAGSFSFAGSVPVELSYEMKDGSPVTDEAAQKARDFGPRLAGVKTRTWPTREDALAAAEALGVTVKESQPADKAARSGSMQKTVDWSNLNLDAMPVEAVAEVGLSPVQEIADGLGVSPVEAEAIKQYASLKSQAMQHRSAGDIPAARVVEEQADKLYRNKLQVLGLW